MRIVNMTEKILSGAIERYRQNNVPVAGLCALAVEHSVAAAMPRGAIGEDAGAFSGREGDQNMGEFFIFPRPSQQHFLGRLTEESSLQAFDYIGAGEGNRTLDIQLGKLSFYH
jgi:hypothetical protein